VGNPNYFDSPYGYRNKGLYAIPEEVANGTNNIGLSTKYKGVLLNQNPQFDPNLPKYSINIPSSVYLSETGKQATTVHASQTDILYRIFII